MANYLFKSIFILSCSILSWGCSKNIPAKYSFFVAGHAYGSPMDKTMGLHPPFVKEVQKINKNKNIELGFFTGDIVRLSKPAYWEAALKDIDKFNCETHVAPGNHDVYHKNLYEKNLNRYYYAFEKNNDLFIVLDGNEGNWNIEGEQLLFLTKTLSEKAEKAGHVFIFVHQLIWWQDKTEFGRCRPNSFMGKADTLVFHQKILPLLLDAQKPVYVFAGDVGVYKDKCSVSNHQIKNVSLVASGMGNHKTDNYLIINVLEDGKVEINIIWLNCETGNDCFGGIEDY